MVQVNLPVPEIHQTKANSCWRACAHMILRHYGLQPGPLMPNEYQADTGLNAANLAILGQRAGLRVPQAVQTPFTVEGLRDVLQRDGPIFAPVSYTPNNRHVVVVTGVTRDAIGEEVYVNDPRLDISDGSSLNVSYALADFNLELVAPLMMVIDLVVATRLHGGQARRIENAEALWAAHMR